MRGRFARIVVAAVCGLLAAATGECPAQTPGPAFLTGRPLQTALADSLGVSWSGQLLREALDSLRRVQHVSIVLDRRVDPNRKVDWSASSLPLKRIIEELAARHDCGVAWIGPTAYVAPTAVATMLPTVITERNAEANQCPDDLRTPLAARRVLIWDDLTEPRGLLEALAREAGLRWTNLDVVPHDLLYHVATPPLSLVERLSIVAAGFELTYQIDPSARTIELRPWPAETAKPAVVKAPPVAPVKPAAPGMQVHTLRVKEVPLGTLIKVLQTKHGLKIRTDDEAIRRAGLTLDKLTAVNVENATLEALLEQAAAPLGLTAKQVGDTVEVGPKR